ncbi:integrase [Bacillus sp. SORGH_AS 510]|uniref:tyrosine-type recombinase/integrase n=1 Tax=Bacillus sp. SORGH_AS_0510 TaxID=3041771 RepID=UPI00278410F1|nr:site-specific integrase [Bacillus sp. SORGH_AS_0510]MDQ1147048.1 integrase [Bacillus sp. SORGH_AS_0510]
MTYTGSVRKEGSKWYYVIEMGKDNNGKRKQKKKRGFQTKKDAQASLTKALHELNSGTYIEPSTQKLGEFLVDWLNYKKAMVAESTYSTYYINLKTHILPELNNMPLSNLKPLHIQQFYSKLLNEKKLHHNTVRKIHTMLVNALDRAVKFDMVAKNAAKLVEPPKESNAEMKVWDVGEVRSFLKAAKDSPFSMVYLIAINTGMRQGEILGLTWESVNLEDNILSVKQTLGHDGKTLKSTTKTAAGMRSIAMPTELAKELRHHKLEQKKQRLKMGTFYTDLNLVVASEVGTPINPSNLRRNFNNLIKKANLERIRFHDLRHTHATLLLKQGVHPKIVSERLGHADTRMTLDRYSHLLPNMQNETAQKFGELLYGRQDIVPPIDQNKIKEPEKKYVTNM